MAQVVLGKNLHDLKTALKARDDLEGDKEKLIKDFQEAMVTVTTLKGLVPICAGCKKVRNDRGYWEQIERYITNSTGLDTTSCFCPECLRKISERRAGDAVSRK
jgi:predicted Fe-S protein YdhL (DUF1289 family)